MEGKRLPLIEPVPIDDELCSGLAMIEDLGFGGRFVFFAKQTSYETGTDLLVVKRKIVLPTDVIGPCFERAIDFLSQHALPRFAR